MKKIKRKVLIGIVRMRRFIKQHLSQRTTVLLLSVVIGLLGAAATVIIKNLMHFTTALLANAFPDAHINYFYLVFPPVGIILTSLFVRKILHDDLSHGVSIVLKSICKNDGKLRLHNVYSSMVSSALTVGFGGSVGLEAPIVLTGSAIGSNLGRFFHLDTKNTTLLLACGCTAAMAAIFKAPIAAIVFVFEVLMLDLTGSAILPLLLSAATGTVMSLLFVGKDVMFGVAQNQDFRIVNIPFYIVLGVLSGFISVYFLRISRWIERIMQKIGNNYWRAIIGGLLLCGLIYVFPVFYGEGYENLSSLMQGSYTRLFSNSPLLQLMNHHAAFMLCIAGIVLIKVFATTITTSSGGIGGIFAPTLFIGAFAGFLVAELSQHYLGFNVPYVNFILAGMAGVMTGVMQAPLTAIFLIAELSTGYTLLIPLMITAACSYLCVLPFEKYSVYTHPLALKGDLKTHNKNRFALRKLRWNKFIDNDVLTIPVNSTLRTYTDVIAHSKRNLFVVIDENELFSGLLVMNDHREIIFKQELYDKVHVEELMIEPEEFIYENDTASTVLDKFNRTGNFNMPVITNDRKYIGFLSKVKFLGAYQRFVAEESDD